MDGNRISTEKVFIPYYFNVYFASKDTPKISTDNIRNPNWKPSLATWTPFGLAKDGGGLQFTKYYEEVEKQGEKYTTKKKIKSVVVDAVFAEYNEAIRKFGKMSDLTYFDDNKRYRIFIEVYGLGRKILRYQGIGTVDIEYDRFEKLMPNGYRAIFTFKGEESVRVKNPSVLDDEIINTDGTEYEPPSTNWNPDYPSNPDGTPQNDYDPPGPGEQPEEPTVLNKYSYPSGSRIFPLIHGDSVGGNTLSAASKTVYFTPIYLSSSVEIAGVWVSARNTWTKNLSIGIYKPNSSGLPGKIIQSKTESFSGSAANNVSSFLVSFEKTLEKGLYWIAIKPEETGASFYTAQWAPDWISTIGPLDSNENNRTKAIVDYTTEGLPLDINNEDFTIISSRYIVGGFQVAEV